MDERLTGENYGISAPLRPPNPRRNVLRYRIANNHCRCYRSRSMENAALIPGPAQKILTTHGEIMLTALQDPFLPNPFAADSEVTPQCGSTQDHTGCTHDFDPGCKICMATMEALWGVAVIPDKLCSPYTVILHPDVAEHIRQELGALPDCYKVVYKIPDFPTEEVDYSDLAEAFCSCQKENVALKDEIALLHKQLAALQPNTANFPQLITGNKLGKSTASQREREVTQRLQRDFPEVKTVQFKSIDFDNRVALGVRLGNGQGLSAAVDRIPGIDILARLESDMRKRLLQNRALYDNQSNDFVNLGMVAAGTEITTGLLNDMVAKQQQAQCMPTSPGQPPDYNAETALCQSYFTNSEL